MKEMSPARLDDSIALNVKHQFDRYYRQSHLTVTILVALLAAFLTVLFIFNEISLLLTITYSVMLTLILAAMIVVNIEDDMIPPVEMVAPLFIVAVYILVFSLVVNPQVALFGPVLFVVYAVAYLYPDIRVSSLNHGLFYLATIILIWFFPASFGLVDMTGINTSYMSIFILILMAFLYISSILMIRRKRYYFKQLAILQENEYKIIEVLFGFQKQYFKTDINTKEYYGKLHSFFEELSNQLGIDNIFSQQLDYVEALNSLGKAQFKSKYPEIPDTLLEELSMLAVNQVKNIRHIALKSSQSENIAFESKIVSDAMFSSFKHSQDSIYIKVLMFCVFYVYFRIPTQFSKGLSSKEFFEIMSSSQSEKMFELTVWQAFEKNQKAVDDIFAFIVKKRLI